MPARSSFAARLLVLLVLALAGLAPSCGSSGADSDQPLFSVGSRGTSPGKFHHPRAIAVDPGTGRFYVVDRTGRIQLFDADGKYLLSWELPEHQFGQPVGLAIEDDGSLLVNDSHYHRILRYSHDGSKLLASWGKEGTGPGELTFGRDVVVDSRGFIYAGDYGGLNDRIEKFSRDGTFLLEWGGRGEEPGRFNRPQGMAIERRGGEEMLLVADCANHRVQRFTLDGNFASSLGRLGSGPGELSYPHSVAVGTDGMIYVSEWGNHRVQRFDPSGASRGFWGRPGRAPGELSTPWDIAVGPGDRLYIADYGNHRVQVFQWADAARSARRSDLKA